MALTPPFLADPLPSLALDAIQQVDVGLQSTFPYIRPTSLPPHPNALSPLPSALGSFCPLRL